jgi:serine/threonine-protein kinase
VRGAAALERPVPFGDRYSLVRRLATGGMAEIYLARQAAMAGFDKEVVIKRLKPELAGDSRIVDMFLDEARIGALLNHPNIVHVYDVDEQGGVPYIAMEYIIGEELNDLCRRGLNVGKFLPLEHAVELIRQAAAGMGYFHAKRSVPDAHHVHGAPLDIVHCDISPTNLLVTEDGFLKIIDFGIARAKGQTARTEGVIPGKLSYMSPEQASRGGIDHRSDIFSLGVVLYEITVGRRLFKGHAQEVVHRLVEGDIEPPTFTRRDFPAGLESIVMRALERDPLDRYQSAYDLADDLEAFLREANLVSAPVRIARYLDELALAQGGTRRPELISETEHVAAGGPDDLGLDAGWADAYAAARPAPEWEDDDESDAEVAAALGIDLAELRAMRTPMPHEADDGGRDVAIDTSGERELPLPPDTLHVGEEAASTNPVPKVEIGDVVVAKATAAATGEAPAVSSSAVFNPSAGFPPYRPVTVDPENIVPIRPLDPLPQYQPTQDVSKKRRPPPAAPATRDPRIRVTLVVAIVLSLAIAGLVVYILR